MPEPTVTVDPAGPVSSYTWDSDLVPAYGFYIWSDGTDIFYSVGSDQYVLVDNSWVVKEWNGSSNFQGSYVWSDGLNIYLSQGSAQYLLEGDTWTPKVWDDLTSFYGDSIFSFGGSIYYCSGPKQYILDNGAWRSVGLSYWGSPEFSLSAQYLWTDGVNLFYSSGSNQYVWNGSSWEVKVWDGLSSFSASCIWSDGVNIFHSNYGSGNTQYILNGSTWVPFDFPGFSEITSGNFFGTRGAVWSDGTSFYYTSGSSTYKFTTVAQSDPVVTSVSVSPSSTTAYPGSVVFFSPTVNGTGSFDSSVTWSISGNTSSGTSVSGGHVTIANDEAPGTITVTATSVADPSVSGSATLTVESAASISGITLVPEFSSAVPGSQIVINAVTSGSGDYDGSLTWTLSGNLSSSTTLTPANGYATLQVATDETAESITVTATSVSDASVTSSLLLDVNASVRLRFSPTETFFSYYGEEIRIPVEFFLTGVDGAGQITDVDNIVLNGLVFDDWYFDAASSEVVIPADSYVSSQYSPGDEVLLFVGFAYDYNGATLHAYGRWTIRFPETCACNSIYDYLRQTFSVYLFDSETGQPSDTATEYSGLGALLVGFFESVDTKLGQLADVMGSETEIKLREESDAVSSEAVDALFGNEETGDEALDISDVGFAKKLGNRFKGWFSSDVSLTDIFDVVEGDNLTGWFSESVGNQIDSTVTTYATRNPDPYNQSEYFEHLEYLLSFVGGD